MLILSKVTIYDGSSGLEFEKGKFKRELRPGEYFYRLKSVSIDVFSTLPVLIPFNGKEAQTLDGGSIKVSLMISVQVNSVRQYFLAGGQPIKQHGAIKPKLSPGQGESSPLMQVRDSAFAACQSWISSREFETWMEKKTELSSFVAEQLKPRMAELGLELLSVLLVEFVPSGNLKSAYSELLRVKLEGRAALDRARNEAATMRNLINTARLVRDHPGLLELRMLV